MRPEARLFARKLLAVARGFVGTSRTGNREQVERFLELFGLPYADPETGKPNAFCAAGVGYAACKAWAFLHNPLLPTDPAALKTYKAQVASAFFLPSPRCREMIDDAKRRGIWRRGSEALKEIQPGCIVFFDWQGDGRADHVEIVEESGVQEGRFVSPLRTVGFNTSDGDLSNGGAVARKERDRCKVFGYIRL